MKHLLVMLLILLLICPIILTSCQDTPSTDKPGSGDDINEGTKQIPIYQGMTITSADSETIGLSSVLNTGSVIPLAGTNNGNGNNGDNGNHYGQHKGDSTDNKNDVNKDDPYPDSDETIETEIESTLVVIGGAKEIYYAEAGQDIYINIHISNPDKYEILSFTLNGEKYSSYMFEQGSTLETLILKMNVGKASGIVEYTIDQIKYVDGTDIKDVMIDGNKTVKAGVRNNNDVSAAISNTEIGTNSISFDANIRDKDALIEYSQGFIKAVLYDGEDLVEVIDLTLGDNHVSFTGLKTHTVYQWAIVATYDNLNGDGVGAHIIAKDAFSTEAAVLFDTISIGKTNMSFSFLWYDTFENKAMTSLELYQGDTLIRELADGTTELGDLFSGTDYSLIAKYINLGKEETIRLDFTTLRMEAYNLYITNTTPTQTSITVTIEESDPDSIGAITGIELLCGDSVVKTADSVTVRSFDGLLSNTAYTVKVYYSYNLNDGSGDKTGEISAEFTTLSKTVPSFSIKSPTSTQTSVGFEIEANDPDLIGAITRIELLCGDSVVKTADSVTVRSFDGLNSYTLYTVRVSFAYDLNEGKGTEENTVLLNISTVARDVSIVNIQVIGDTTVNPGKSTSLIVEFANPDKVTITSLNINGVEVSLQKSSNTIYACSYTSVSDGGREFFSCNQISYTLYGDTVSQATSYKSQSSITVLGSVSVKEIYTEKDCYFVGESAKIIVKFNGSEGYDMQSISFGTLVLDLNKIDDTTYYCSLTETQPCSKILSVTNITYGIDDTTLSVQSSSKNIYTVYVRNYGDPIDISTPEQLQNLEWGKSYRLVNDIDLTGFDWEPYEFAGKLDGNGYVIKNLSITKNYTKEADYNSVEALGLFSYGGGHFENVKLLNAKITIISKYNVGVHVGLLIGHNYEFDLWGDASTPYFTYFNNCEVYGDIMYLADHGQEGCYTFMGGIIGSSDDDYALLSNCYYQGELSLSVIDSPYYSYMSLQPISGFGGTCFGCSSDNSAMITGDFGGYQFTGYDTPGKYYYCDFRVLKD